MFQNDIGTVLEFVCRDQDNNALDLTTAEHAYLFIKRGNTILKREMTIDVDPSSGKVSYAIAEDDFTEGLKAMNAEELQTIQKVFDMIKPK